MLDDLAGHRVGHAFLLMPLALLEAAQGNFAEARRHLATGRGILEELGRRVDLGIALNMAAEVEHLAGDPAAGELAAREALDIFRAAGVARNRAVRSGRAGAPRCSGPEDSTNPSAGRKKPATRTPASGEPCSRRSCLGAESTEPPNDSRKT